MDVFFFILFFIFLCCRVLIRSGRFDMVVFVLLFNVKEREDMFVYYLSKVRYDSCK